jgi:hypothetical protein
MKPFSPVLQDQDFRLIVDSGNRSTITMATRPEASQATVATHLIRGVLGNS